MTFQQNCPDCGTAVGHVYINDCDIERRSVCKTQPATCGCEGHDPGQSVWTDVWPEVMKSGEYEGKNRGPLRHYNSMTELFADSEFADYMQAFWPIFAQAADNLCLENGKLGQECGKMRERFLIYLFARYIGKDTERCDVDHYGIDVVERGKDVKIFGRDVSIKTISYGRNGFGGVKVSWIENEKMASHVQSSWRPEFDLLLCRLHWNSSNDGIYYISKQVQEVVLRDSERCLKTPGGYGKGTALTSDACEALVTHPGTLKLPIKMPKERRDDNALDQYLDRLYLKTRAGGRSVAGARPTRSFVPSATMG